MGEAQPGETPRHADGVSDASDVAAPGDARFDTVTIRWEAATPDRPLLREVHLVPSDGVTVMPEDPVPVANMPHGRRLRWPREKTPALGTGKGASVAYPLTGEAVRTGYEPLAALVRLRRSGSLPLGLRGTPEHYGAGKPKPQAGFRNRAPSSRSATCAR